MQIINSSKNLKTVDIYRLTKSPNTKKMSEAKGERIELSAWALYQDADKKTGELREILAVSDSKGNSYATNSPTFIADFVEMVNLFEEAGETVPAITVISGTSKAGREFISCAYCE